MCAILCHSASSIMMPHSVILNAVKNLEASEAVDGSTCLEILRYTQDDIEPTMARRCFDFAQHDIVSEPTLTPKSQNHEITLSQGVGVVLFLVISVIRADSTTPKITLSQCHSVTVSQGVGVA